MTKRYTIVPKVKGKFIIPVIQTRYFDSPKKLGSYCADNGTLWTSLDDGERIFEDEELAKLKLQELISYLFG